MIRDMELIISQIKNEIIQEYFEEALKCYSVKSYRACVILSVIAGMYDLREKINALASTVKAARELDDAITEAINEQNTFEKYMIEQAATEKLGILSPSERDVLLSYLAIRNRCAHPGGHFSSAEEARAVFAGIFDNILLKPARLGASYINVVVEDLKDGIFFPNKSPETIREISNELYVKLHESAMMPLCKRLVKIIEDPLSDGISKTNAINLLGGLTLCFDESMNVRLGIILTPIIAKPSTNISLFELLFVNPLILQALNKSDKTKALARLNNDLGSPDHNIKLLLDLTKKIFSFSILSEEERTNLIITITNSNMKFKDSFYDFFNTGNLTKIEQEIILERLKEGIRSIKIEHGINPDRMSSIMLKYWKNTVYVFNNAELDEIFFGKLLELIENGDYGLSNSGVDLLQELNEEFITRASKEIQRDFVAEVINAAGHGGNSAKKLLEKGFDKRKEILDAFNDDLLSSNESFTKIIEKVWRKERLFEYIIKTNQAELLDLILKRIVIKEYVLKTRDLEEIWYELKRLNNPEYSLYSEEIEKIIDAQYAGN